MIDQTSLPIVLKPKPATDRLEVVDRGSLLKWMVTVDVRGEWSWWVTMGDGGWP